MDPFENADICKFLGVSKPSSRFLRRKLLIERIILKIGLHPSISIAYEYAHTVFSFPSRLSFPRGGLQNYSFQVVSFRNGTYAKSLETGKVKVDFAL